MKKNFDRKWSLALLTLGLGLAGCGVQAQHINAGALSTAQDGQLYFQNVSGFVNASGFVITNREITLAQSTTPVTSLGWFEVSGLSFTALGATSNALHNSSPFAAAPGSFIELRLENVLSGPAGGTFGFWDHDNTTSLPSLSLGVGGSVASGNLIELSDATLGAGTIGGDPFGHIHGRRYGVDLPGDYQVGFRLLDTSANGVGGNPLQSPSELYLLTFHAVPEPSVIALGMAGATAIGFAIRRARNKRLKQE